MADVTTPTTATPGLLDEVRSTWAARGWNPAILDTFRMEGEGGDGGGGEGGGNGGQGGTASSPPPATPPVPAPTGEGLEALQRIADQAKAGGSAEAQKQVAALLGVENFDAAQKRITELLDLENQGKTEAQRAIEARQEAERQAQEANGGKTAAEVALLKTHALMRHGITDADQINGLLDLVKIDGDPSAETAMAAVETVKATFPALFEAPTGDGERKPSAPHTVPPRQPAGTPPKPGEAGRERAKKLKETQGKGSREALLAKFGPQPTPFTTNSN